MAQIKDMSAASRSALNSRRRELNYGKDRNAIPATGVSVAPETLSLKVGETGRITAIVAPNDSIQRGVWTLSANDIVSMNENTLTVAQDIDVTALKAGTVTATFTSEDGDFTDTCEITVTAAS